MKPQHRGETCSDESLYTVKQSPRRRARASLRPHRLGPCTEEPPRRGRWQNPERSPGYSPHASRSGVQVRRASADPGHSSIRGSCAASPCRRFPCRAVAPLLVPGTSSGATPPPRAPAPPPRSCCSRHSCATRSSERRRRCRTECNRIESRRGHRHLPTKGSVGACQPTRRHVHRSVATWPHRLSGCCSRGSSSSSRADPP